MEWIFSGIGTYMVEILLSILAAAIAIWWKWKIIKNKNDEKSNIDDKNNSTKTAKAENRSTAINAGNLDKSSITIITSGTNERRSEAHDLKNILEKFLLSIHKHKTIECSDLRKLETYVVTPKIDVNVENVFNDLKRLHDFLIEYNKLPRIPGEPELISKFVKEYRLIEKIYRIKSKMESY